MLAHISAHWDGLLVVTGDINIDTLKPDSPLTKQYSDILRMYDLEQIVTKPTRITAKSKTLIDHFITNHSNHAKKVTHTNVLPCPLISDHSASYICVNARVTRFVPRHTFIREERYLSKSAFIDDVRGLPMNTIYGVDDPDEKLEIFNTPLFNCIERHAPLKRTKMTRPPAPWLKDDGIKDLQLERNKLRHDVRATNDPATWKSYRESRNNLKSKIKKAKRNFRRRALSKRNSSEVWQVIHRVLKPNPQPLKQNPDSLNSHFASIADRTVNASAKTVHDLRELINSLPECRTNWCYVRRVTYHEVLK